MDVQGKKNSITQYLGYAFLAFLLIAFCILIYIFFTGSSPVPGLAAILAASAEIAVVSKPDKVIEKVVEPKTSK